MECRSPPRLFVSPSHPGQQMAHLSHLGLADAPPRGKYSAPRANHAAANLEVASPFVRLYPLLGCPGVGQTNTCTLRRRRQKPPQQPLPLSPSCPWSPNAAGVAHTMLLSDTNATKPEGGNPISPGPAELAGEAIFASHKSKKAAASCPSPFRGPAARTGCSGKRRSERNRSPRPTYYENHAAPASRLAVCL